MDKNMCRACMSLENTVEYKHFSLVLTSEENHLTIGQIFNRICRLDNKARDELPQKICPACLEELTICYKFQEKCINSEEKFLKILDDEYVDIEVEVTETDTQIIELEKVGETAKLDKDICRERNFKVKNIVVEASVIPNIPSRKPNNSVVEKPNQENCIKPRFKCPTCNKTFGRQSNLNRHLKGHKPDDVLKFECENCDWKFINEIKLFKHRLGVHNENVDKKECYKCPYCPRNFEKKSSRTSHMQYHKPDDINDENIMETDSNQIEEDTEIKSEINITEAQSTLKIENYEDSFDNEYVEEASDNSVELPDPKNKRKAEHICDFCKKVFDRIHRLKRHLNVHNSKGKPFECKICKYRFSSKQNLTKHEVSHTLATEEEPKQQNKPQINKCLYCPRKFLKKLSLASHMRVHKKGFRKSLLPQKTYKCQFCPKSFFKISSLVKHISDHGVQSQYRCVMCKQIFELKDEIIEHLNWHKGVKPYSCDICTAGFHESAKLKSHLKTHTTEKNFLCTECGKSFGLSYRKQHMLLHSGEKPFKCEQCPAKFICRDTLYTHQVVHTKVKAFSCELCSTKFTRGYSLKKHMLIHTGERPFACSTCPMTFRSSDVRNRHMLIHTGEKPHVCEFCSRAFTQKNDLTKHLKSHLGDKIYKCDKCSESFRLQLELREHLYEHYRLEKENGEIEN